MCQWVLTLPHSLRYSFAFDGGHLGKVLRLFTDRVASWYRRNHPEGETPVFEAVPKPTQEDIEGLVQWAKRRILRYLEKRGIPRCGRSRGCGCSPGSVSERFVRSSPFAAAPGDGEVTVLIDESLGQSDPEMLCRYILRPPLANKRLHLSEDGGVIGRAARGRILRLGVQAAVEGGYAEHRTGIQNLAGAAFGHRSASAQACHVVLRRAFLA